MSYDYYQSQTEESNRFDLWGKHMVISARDYSFGNAIGKSNGNKGQ